MFTITVVVRFYSNRFVVQKVQLNSSISINFIKRPTTSISITYTERPTIVKNCHNESLLLKLVKYND